MAGKPQGTVPERFWPKVDKNGPGGCWNWTATLNEAGYGRFSIGTGPGRDRRAHRVSFELVRGPIPDGLDLDHLCRNRRCVNPAHLEPVTRRENVLRGYGPPAVNARRTHCKRGHELAGANLLIRSDTSARVCRLCRAAA